MRDVIVVGGGPAGLATAIALAQRGARVLVLEKHGTPPDKACGEGILPPGVRALEALGVAIDPRECAPIEGIRYVEPDGPRAEGRLATPGLCVRRTALTDALEARAREAGVEVRHGARVDDHRSLRAGLVVAADGLHSRIRRAAGLERPAQGPRRFGLRQHFAARAPDRFVEVHFADGVEAYVAGSADERTSLTFLFDEDAASPPSIPALLARFPRIAARLAGATPLSTPRGAGPLRQRARAQVADRLVLVGDAAGYIDAITGEGLSLAFGCALALADIFTAGAGGEPLPPPLPQPDGLEREAREPSAPPRPSGFSDRGSFGRYQRAYDRLYRRYAALTETVLALARHPRARRATLIALRACPRVFDRVLGWTVT